MYLYLLLVACTRPTPLALSELVDPTVEFDLQETYASVNVLHRGDWCFRVPGFNVFMDGERQGSDAGSNRVLTFGDLGAARVVCNDDHPSAFIDEPVWSDRVEFDLTDGTTTWTFVVLEPWMAERVAWVDGALTVGETVVVELLGEGVEVVDVDVRLSDGAVAETSIDDVVIDGRRISFTLPDPLPPETASLFLVGHFHYGLDAAPDGVAVAPAVFQWYQDFE